MEDSRQFAEKASGYFEERTASIYELYERRLQECGAFDFDDLIFRTVRILGGREDIRNKYTRRLRYILVDEYQDTNHSQYQLLKLLVGPQKNICAVGDEDQSIYGWRGADITNILNFEKDFPSARVIKMEQNYRSTGIILEAASEVISNNVNRKDKILKTEQGAGEKIGLFLTDSASDEAGAVIDTIVANRNRYQLNDMAVLYRTNAQSRAFEEHLRRFDLPYQIIGGVSFYQRKEIKDIIAYLKLIANPRDDISLQRIINYPRRGIGNTTVGKLRESAARTGQSMLDICLKIEEQEEFGSRPQKLLRQFGELISTYIKKKAEYDIAIIAGELIDELRITEHLIDEDPTLGPERAKNVEELIAAAEEFTGISEEPTLDNFLAEISLYTDIDQYNEIDDKLTLMTLHSAKGLEFDAVFVAGLEEGLFPLARANEDPDEMEEERRLFYVGATRAKKNLFLSMAVNRGRYGELESIPSRFLKELPPGLVDIEDSRSFRPAGYGRTKIVSRAKENQADQVGIRYEYEEEEILRVGRIVQHPTFGRGTVLKVEGAGESLRLEIRFTGVGIKKIIPRYARLKVVG
jgi:DNA helicase-2/ATP-dependent DNA helicase PcrA